MIVKLDELCELLDCSSEEIQSYEFFEDNLYKVIPVFGYESYEQWANDAYPEMECEFYVPKEYRYNYDKWITDGCPMVRNPDYYDDED